MKQSTDSLKVSSIIRQALTVNKIPFPWLKAFRAGLAASVPILIGLLLGNFQYGLIAGLGGFSYLYVFNIPYAQLAKKLFGVIFGMTLVTALGTLAAPYPLASSIIMGIIGATAIFIFGALRISGPSAIFFILVYAMTTGMPIDPDSAFLRAGLVFLGGVLSFIIAMSSWFFNPHGPETAVVKRVYMQLAELIDSVGTEKFNTVRNNVRTMMKESDETLAAGYLPWHNTDQFNRLFILNDHAHSIFVYILENFAGQKSMLPPELGKSIRVLANSLDRKSKTEPLKILQPKDMDEHTRMLFTKVYDADAVMNEPVAKINRVVNIDKPSLKDILLGAFDKNSIVFISAVRFGIILTFAAIIAYQFGFNRSYWVPLSCAAVMSGATIVATFHRAIQRSLGTILGILIAGVVLATQPSGMMVAVFVLILTFITELFIVKNYGLAALFFTPSALIMAESTTQGFSFSYFAQARLIDILIGSMIGLMGVLLVGRKSASSRLPHLISKTIRSQAQLLLILFSDQGKGFNPDTSRERIKMRTNLTNLKTLYNTALGEVPSNQKALNYYWPILFHIDQLAFLLETTTKDTKRPILPDANLAEILFAFETMANAAARVMPPAIKNISEVTGYTGIQKEIVNLQKAFQLSQT